MRVFLSQKIVIISFVVKYAKYNYNLIFFLKQNKVNVKV